VTSVAEHSLLEVLLLSLLSMGRDWTFYIRLHRLRPLKRRNQPVITQRRANVCIQWRRLHRAQRARSPAFTNGLARGEGTVSRKTTNKKLTKLFWPS